MKTAAWVCVGMLVLVAFGCSTPQRGERRQVKRVQIADPQPPAIVLAPSSNRPVSRVYNELGPGTDPEYSEVPPRVIILDSPGDSALNYAIRRMFGARPALAMRARNVRISEREGNILLEGWVDSPEDEKLLRQHLSQLHGVNMIDSRLGIGPPR